MKEDKLQKNPWLVVEIGVLLSNLIECHPLSIQAGLGGNISAHVLDTLRKILILDVQRNGQLVTRMRQTVRDARTRGNSTSPSPNTSKLIGLPIPAFPLMLRVAVSDLSVDFERLTRDCATDQSTSEGAVQSVGAVGGHRAWLLIGTELYFAFSCIFASPTVVDGSVG